MLNMIHAFNLTLTSLILLLSAEVECSPEARLIQGSNTNLGQALQFLREYDKEASEMCFRVRSAQWNYSTNMTDYNKRKMIDEQTHKAKFDKLSWKRAIAFDWTSLQDSMARRQLKFLVTSGRASLSDEKYNEIYHLISEMKEIYSRVRICSFNNVDYCDLELDSDVIRIMTHSRNPEELLHVWKEWHDKTGPPMKNRFMRYVQLANQAARLNGFMDAGEQMRYIYEDKDFEFEIADTFQKLMPLYKQLFTYVRQKLYFKYGPAVLRPDGAIPAHLLGNLWGQEWSSLSELVMPYPSVKNIDVTDELLRQGFTSLRIFQMAEEFFTSLGLKPMPPEFWRHSVFDKPNDRKMQCTASAWDFCNKIDYRIKQCTEVETENLATTHHEMAHIQYYLQYADQPYLYRDGANPGFHEGMANAILLSAYNPIHLHRVGLLYNSSESYETNMNFLMSMALNKITYAPFAFLVDQWRYGVFRDGVQNMNSAWWDLRLRYQGVTPPLPRSEQHLDAAGKRHIPADVPYIKYYVALLLEFQIYEALCYSAGHVGQLHTCNIYRSREAGRLLEEVLKVGKARHWKDVIRTLTKGRTDRLSAEPMLNYFHPLEAWLKVQNRDEKIIGWNIYMEDNALFQPLQNTSCNIKKALQVIVFSVLLRMFI